MNLNTSRALVVGRAAAVLSLVGALLTISTGTARAQSGKSASQADPVGTWVVQVSHRDCTTNAAVGAPSSSLVTLHRGGTLSESPGGVAFAAGQRSPGHGVWEHQGKRTYTQRLVALILFDTAPNLPGSPEFNPGMPVSPGFFAGWQTVTHTITLSDAGHLTSAGTSEFYKSDGELYRTVCSTAAGRRFE